jgi:hypothetical protein
MSYNGWKNYETWNVALWVDNDQGSYYRRNEILDDLLSEHEGNTDAARIPAADALKNFVEDEVIGLEDLELPGPAADLLNAALSEVDWFEIAENWLEEAKERYTPEDEN